MLLQDTIAHGFAGRRGGVVTIAVELLPDRLTAALTDDGQPFTTAAAVATSPSWSSD
jgi:anti-sigma regulatory factor (Ser/Thr protein kinase)